MWVHIWKVTEKFKTPHVIHKFKTDAYVWFSDSSSIGFYLDLHTGFFVWKANVVQQRNEISDTLEWWMKKRVAKTSSGCPMKKRLLFRTFCIQNANPGDCEYLHIRLMFPDGVYQSFIWTDVDWLPTFESARRRRGRRRISYCRPDLDTGATKNIRCCIFLVTTGTCTNSFFTSILLVHTKQLRNN